MGFWVFARVFALKSMGFCNLSVFAKVSILFMGFCPTIHHTVHHNSIPAGIPDPDPTVQAGMAYTHQISSKIFPQVLNRPFLTLNIWEKRINRPEHHHVVHPSESSIVQSKSRENDFLEISFRSFKNKYIDSRWLHDVVLFSSNYLIFRSVCCNWTIRKNLGKDF